MVEQNDSITYTSPSNNNLSSQTDKIKIPSFIWGDKLSDSLLESIKVINSINNCTKKLCLVDYSALTFVTPLYILPLVVYLDSCDKEVVSYKLSEYLETVKFPIGLRPDRMRKSEFLTTMEQYSQRTYIPIISFPASKESNDEKDAILSTVESIIVRQVGIDSNVTMGIKYMLGEAIDNIIQHAKSDRGYIFAQSNPSKGYLDICIADSGITLLGSYKTLSDNEIENDIEAIQAANRGISTKNLPNAENRGYGIITSKKMLVDGLNGSFVMMSGNALHLYNSIYKKFVEAPVNIRWNGTIIALRIPYKNKDFQYINYLE